MKFTKRLKLIAEKLSALMTESYLSERTKRISRTQKLMTKSGLSSQFDS